MKAEEIIEAARARTRPQPNRFLEELAAGRVTEAGLRRLAGEQYRILVSDRRSFSLLASRFPENPAGDLFLGLAAGEGRALTLLHRFAGAFGWAEPDLTAYEPHPSAQAYPAFVAQCAAYGPRSAIVTAMLTNLDEWGGYCARVAEILAGPYGLAEEAVEFFRFFSAPPPGFAAQATAVIQAGLDAGDDPAEAVRAARLLHAYETWFWDSLLEL
ncbi:transcriptional regulator [Bailinhaonella thermotolerans]|uniref:Transcriptional regulator n=1 Tax=Bailinhaonella thermotolerans TaxID=1070861 RepID=A0A3A4BC13_9ACTN|nr:transcriptional regulator [Bailinhaonella thermotolerans]RJL31718.1 transcriptional regulator [Bailinhaonella thermotolerans]